MKIQLTVDEWEAKGIKLFGEDKLKWEFVCPSCGYVASVSDWKKAGASPGEVAFSCVGRNLEKPKNIGGKPGPCNYAGGGLFRLNPVRVLFPDGGIGEYFSFKE